MRCIELNPERAGLLKQARHWPWSSAGRSVSGWIAFLLAVDEAGMAPGNFYELSSFEATYADDWRPYLYW